MSPRDELPYKSMNLLVDGEATSGLRSEFYGQNKPKPIRKDDNDTRQKRHLLPPTPRGHSGRKYVRKTKSSNNQPARYGGGGQSDNDLESLRGNRSASWRNFTSIELNCPNNTKLKDYDMQVLIG